MASRSSVFFAISAMICLLATIYILLSPSLTSATSESFGSRVQQALYHQTHHKGWGIPGSQQWDPGCRPVGSEWNIFYHLGGNGPWIEKIDGVVDSGIKVPEGCEVDMVHMMSRHGERYPTKKAGSHMIELVERVKSKGKKLEGALAFLNDWEYFTNSPNSDFEQLTRTGPYCGTLEAFTTGIKLGTRYRHLTNNTKATKTLLWASECDRVIDTARYFSAGFFGLENEVAEVEIISEEEERGGDTLTPGGCKTLDGTPILDKHQWLQEFRGLWFEKQKKGSSYLLKKTRDEPSYGLLIRKPRRSTSTQCIDTCTKYVTDEERGHDMGYKKLKDYTSTYLSNISKRLAIENPGLNFTDPEVYSMQEMCGFDTLVRGHSKWCDVFTQQEWLQFEYARDVIHYYRAGGNAVVMLYPGTRITSRLYNLYDKTPGNPYSKAMGWLWLNATTNLLLEGPANAGPLYFSFVHDGDIVPMLSALGLFSDPVDLPVTHIATDRKWKTSQITPMGGRIIFERLSCPGTKEKQFVRFNVNDGIVPMADCNHGPGSSCPLLKFAEYVKNRGEEAGDFRTVCGLPEDAAPRLTFLRQPGYGGVKI